jgi:6-phosphofructokinase 1
VVVVAEGAKPKANTMKTPERNLDAYGHEKLGDVAHAIAPEISARTGFETRVVQLGYIQRGGTPTSYDRVLSTRFGLAAVDAVHARKFGQMVVLKAGQIETADMSITANQTRTIDLKLFADVAATFFG